MNLFKKFFASLNQASVKYMIAGGIAVNLYGIERATADINIILKLDEENIRKFIETAKKLELKPKMPVLLEDFLQAEKRKEWIETKDMVVFSLCDLKNPFFLLDVFAQEPFDFNEVYKQRERIEFEEISLSVVPIRYLIEMKEKTGRLQDKADVFYLKKIKEEWENGKE